MIARILVVGLLVNASWVAAPALAEAPLGNPGFEQGADLSPWLQGLGVLDYPHDEFWSATNTTANSGDWSANNVGNNELRQNFSPIETTWIEELSVFVRKDGPLGTLESAIQLHYMDGSFSQHTLNSTQAGVWEKHDVSEILAPDKQLTALSVFGIRSDITSRTYVDDFAIVVPECGSAVSALVVLAALARGGAARRRYRHPQSLDRVSR